MGKVGDRLKEFIELAKLIQPMGKWRLGLLGIEVFVILLVSGIILEKICIAYIIITAILSVLYVITVLIVTLNRLQ